MKKNNRKKLLTIRKSSIAQLHKNEAATLNGGSSLTVAITVTLFEDCTSIICTIPPAV